MVLVRLPSAVQSWTHAMSPKPPKLHPCLVTLALMQAGGCAGHEDIPEPAAPVLAPAIVQEAEPAPVLPPVVGAPLPELAPDE